MIEIIRRDCRDETLADALVATLYPAQGAQLVHSRTLLLLSDGLAYGMGAGRRRLREAHVPPRLDEYLPLGHRVRSVLVRHGEVAALGSIATTPGPAARWRRPGRQLDRAACAGADRSTSPRRRPGLTAGTARLPFASPGRRPPPTGGRGFRRPVVAARAPPDGSGPGGLGLASATVLLALTRPDGWDHHLFARQHVARFSARSSIVRRLVR